jgi:hypothetical protein
MIVYRTTDRIPVKMGPVTAWVSPFSYEQKIKLASCTKLQAGVEQIDAHKIALLSVKFAIKEVEGLTDLNGQPYELAFDTDGTLTEECVSDLMQIVGSSSLAAICYKLSLNIENHKLEGAEVVLSESKSVQKKT